MCAAQVNWDSALWDEAIWDQTVVTHTVTPSSTVGGRAEGRRHRARGRVRAAPVCSRSAHSRTHRLEVYLADFPTSHWLWDE